MCLFLLRDRMSQSLSEQFGEVSRMLWMHSFFTLSMCREMRMSRPKVAFDGLALASTASGGVGRLRGPLHLKEVLKES